MINEFFTCLKCGQYRLKYKGNGVFSCEACPNVFTTPQQGAICQHCYAPYRYYTSFDPANCPSCKKSFGSA